MIMEDFKKKMQEDLIPRIKGLLKREQAHYDYLKDCKNDLRLLNNTNIELDLDGSIATSERFINHYTIRIQQYIKYADAL